MGMCVCVCVCGGVISQLLGLQAHCKEIIEEVGVPIVSNQVQFSLLDRRPLTKGMAAYFATKGVKILAYGTLYVAFFRRYLWCLAESTGMRTAEHSVLTD